MWCTIDTAKRYCDQSLEHDFYKVISQNVAITGRKVLITLNQYGSTGAECRVHVDRINHDNFKLWYDP